MQLWSRGQSWDDSVLGVVDADSYAGDVRDSMAEQTPSGSIDEEEAPKLHQKVSLA